MFFNKITKKIITFNNNLHKFWKKKGKTNIKTQI